jgi:hypothetical protein
MSACPALLSGISFATEPPTGLPHFAGKVAWSQPQNVSECRLLANPR